jgi:hypothetical protein
MGGVLEGKQWKDKGFRKGKERSEGQKRKL